MGRGRDVTHGTCDHPDQGARDRNRESTVSKEAGTSGEPREERHSWEGRWLVSAVCDAQMDRLNMEKSKNTDLVIKSHWGL